MGNLNLSQVYFWKKDSVYAYPWQRQFLNIDFLKYEQKRIRDVGKWYHDFQKSKVGDSLSEVYYYVTPLELDSEWKAAIALKGNYNYIGLSALKNCLQLQLLVLIPKDKTVPRDYSLVRILKSKKDFIHHVRGNDVVYVIISDDFKEEDAALVYVDVPFEKRIISKFIKENLVNDDLIADSFQSTISSSPYVINKKGGISFSAFLKNSPFSEELMNTLKMMQPIEFSDIQSQIPSKLTDGANIISSKGVRFHVAEKSILGNNYYSAFSSNDYGKLNNELIKRDMFNGEYSIACSLTPRGDKASELLRDVISKFVKTEVMHPYSSDELKYWDVDLLKIQRNIDEDLWLQVVNQRQLKPIVEGSLNVSTLRQNLVKEWEAILESLGLKKNIGHEAKVYSAASFSNILRVAQSMSRDIQKNSVTESILTKSFKLFTQNADGLINNDEIQNHVKVVIPERFESAKFNAIRAELSVNLLDIKELFSNVKNYFKDIFELQELIDKKLLPNGYLFEPKRGFYKWI
ncbi:MAG: hypothetical protein ABIC04_04665 [Nanoarchaeota archaeon]